MLDMKTLYGDLHATPTPGIVYRPLDPNMIALRLSAKVATLTLQRLPPRL